MFSRNTVGIFFVIVVISTLYRGVSASCLMHYLGSSKTLQAYSGDSIHETCRFWANCVADVQIYRELVEDHRISTNINSLDLKDEGLLFRQRCRYDKENEQYVCDLIMNTFDSSYSGKYYCVITERNNTRNQLRGDLIFLTTQSFDTFPSPACFLPSAENITIDSVSYPNGSVEVTLLWSASVKEANNINYCVGSRRWRVHVRSFDNVDSTPGDRTVHNYGHGWKNVPSRDEQYMFSELLNNNSYYQFLVGNRPDRVNYKEVRTFGSSIYYFGKQSVPIIKQAQQHQTITINQMDSTTVECTASGIPSPTVRWINSNSQSVDQTSLEGSSTLILRDVTFTHEGTYLCIAQNMLVNPPLGKRVLLQVWQVTVNVEEYNTSSTGSVCGTSLLPSDSYCKNYLHSHFPIYTNLSISKELRKERVGTAMTKIIEHVSDIKCQDLAKSLLCHTVYPYCDVRHLLRPLPRPICSTACSEFTGVKCRSYATVMKRQDPLLYQLISSKCVSTEGGQAPECIPITFEASRSDETQPVVDTGSCMRGNGIGYSGTQVHTKSGHLCQLWTQQSPHKHPMLPAIYASELQNAGYACRNPGGLGDRPWCYTTNVNVRWEYCNIPLCDTCETYNGTMCSKISGYRNGKVFVRKGKSVSTWTDIEKDLIQLFAETRYLQRPSKGCEHLFEVLLCHSAFPLCDGNKPKQLCTDHCMLRHTIQQLCPTIYQKYMQFAANLLNSGFVSTINCESANHSSCLDSESLSIPVISNEVDPANTTFTCYNGTGELYRGNVSVTQTGLTCLMWNSDVSNTRIINSKYYLELIDAKNYCRNPDGLMSRPWCFTNSTTGWDYCAIGFCSDSKTFEDPDAANPQNDELGVIDGGPRTTLTALVYSFSMILVFFIIAIVCVGIVIGLIRKRRKIMKSKNLLKTASVLKEDKFVVNSNYLQTTSSNSRSQIPENFKMLEAKQIKYVSQLGQGNFGIVFKGRAFNVSPDEDEIEVAVKTLKEEASSEIVSNFIDEAKLMFTFSHTNILTIYGVCMSEMPYQMVFEYMDGGDLTQFLRSKASSTQRRLLNPFGYRSARTESSYSNDPPSLSKTQLLSLCKQIADGMKYLASMKHVHRDLACRNCLINSDLKIKIGDFGMSRNLYSRDYYRVNGQAILPVRWMPPEALIYGKFSVEGDVWSFGVVMWEVFSFALQPYYGLSNEEVTEAIRHGKILHRPDDCPAEIYGIMKECWDMDAKCRPTFDELHNEIVNLYHCAELDSESESDNFSYNSDDSDAFLSENSLPEDAIAT